LDYWIILSIYCSILIKSMSSGGGKGFSSETINRLTEYGIKYQTKDGLTNITFTNLELRSYIQKNFDKKFELDTINNPLGETKTTDFSLSS